MEQEYNGSREIIQEITDLLKQRQITASAALKMMLKLEIHNLKIRQEMADRITANTEAVEKLKFEYRREIELLKRVGVGYSIYSNPRKAFIILLSLYSLAASGLVADLFNWIFEHIKLFL